MVHMQRDLAARVARSWPSLDAFLRAQDGTSVEGYQLLVGGGMGRSHGKASTYARLAEPLGFVPADDIFHAVKVGLGRVPAPVVWWSWRPSG